MTIPEPRHKNAVREFSWFRSRRYSIALTMFCIGLALIFGRDALAKDDQLVKPETRTFEYSLENASQLPNNPTNRQVLAQMLGKSTDALNVCTESTRLFSAERNCKTSSGRASFQIVDTQAFDKCSTAVKSLASIREITPEKHGAFFLLTGDAAQITRLRPPHGDLSSGASYDYLSEVSGPGSRPPSNEVNLAIIDSGIYRPVDVFPTLNLRCSLDFTDLSVTHDSAACDGKWPTTASSCPEDTDDAGAQGSANCRRERIHGTHVGLVAAGYCPDSSNLPPPTVCHRKHEGAAPGAPIFDLKACGANKCEYKHILRAFKWIEAYNEANGRRPKDRIHVVNMSFTNYIDDPNGNSEYAVAANELVEKANVIAVAGFGHAANDGTHVTGGTVCKSPPGSAKNVLAVTGANLADGTPMMNKYFLTTKYDIQGYAGKPNVTAPTKFSVILNHGQANVALGSSFASAHVSGIAAAVLTRMDSQTQRDRAALQFRVAAENTANKGLHEFDSSASDESWSNLYGHGMIDARKIHNQLSGENSAVSRPAESPDNRATRPKEALRPRQGLRR